MWNESACLSGYAWVGNICGGGGGFEVTGVRCSVVGVGGCYGVCGGGRRGSM